MSTQTGARIRAPRVARWVAVLALLWVGCVLLVHLAFGHFACGLDTSGCAPTRNKTMVFQGHLPFANTPFQVVFYSVQRAGGGPVGGFRTDSHGRYCIVWAPETGIFVIQGSQHYGYFDVNNGHVLDGRPPAGCRYGNQNVPWFRADDLTSSPQYISIIVLTLLTLVVLVVGIVSGRTIVGASVRASGVALAFASTLLFLVVWWPKL